MGVSECGLLVGELVFLMFLLALRTHSKTVWTKKVHDGELREAVIAARQKVLDQEGDLPPL